VGEDDLEGAEAVLLPLLEERTVPVEVGRWGQLLEEGRGRGRECGKGRERGQGGGRTYPLETVPSPFGFHDTKAVGEDDREGAGAVLPPLLVERTVPVAVSPL
jgi:hypothetical protein